MRTTPIPDSDHAQFDEICAQLDEHEPLPTVTAKPAEEPEPSEEDRTAPIDELILAGLVSPY